MSKVLRVLPPLAGVVVFSLGVFYFSFSIRNGRRTKGHNINVNWKITRFHLLNLSEDSIISGVTANNLIGRGGSRQVYRIVALNNCVEEVVAVKKIFNNSRVDKELEKQFQAEVEFLGNIRHRNIVKLYCCISSDDSKLFVYEYMENGSLYQWLHKERSSEAMEGGLDWPTRLRIAIGAAHGLCYMHNDCRPSIVHRDVKSANILLDSKFVPKIADFGLSRTLVKVGEAESVSAIAGSFGYMAPECAYTRKIDEKVDVYSFGVVLLELVTGKKANNGDGDYGCSLAEWAWQHFRDGKPILDVVDEEIRNPMYVKEMNMVTRLGFICTSSLPSSRPSMKQVLQALVECDGAAGNGDRKLRENDVAPLLQDNK